MEAEIDEYLLVQDDLLQLLFVQLSVVLHPRVYLIRALVCHRQSNQMQNKPAQQQKIYPNSVHFVHFGQPAVCIPLPNKRVCYVQQEKIQRDQNSQRVRHIRAES